MSAAIRIVLFARSAIYFAFLVVTVIPYAVAVLLWSWIPNPRRYWLATGLSLIHI